MSADEAQLRTPPDPIPISKPLNGNILICKLRKLTAKGWRSALNALRLWLRRKNKLNFKNTRLLAGCFLFIYNANWKLFCPVFSAAS